MEENIRAVFICISVTLLLHHGTLSWNSGQLSTQCLLYNAFLLDGVCFRPINLHAVLSKAQHHVWHSFALQCKLHSIGPLHHLLSLSHHVTSLIYKDFPLITALMEVRNHLNFGSIKWFYSSGLYYSFTGSYRVREFIYMVRVTGSELSELFLVRLWIAASKSARLKISR